MSKPAQNDLSPLEELARQTDSQQSRLQLGGRLHENDAQAIPGKLSARQRIDALVDSDCTALEIGLWAGHNCVELKGAELNGDQEEPAISAASTITTIARIAGRWHMILADDPSINSGAVNPASIKKILRAQQIALQCRLPLVTLIDSLSVLLPLAEDIFPQRDDAARIAHNSAAIKAAGLSQIVAIMGNCTLTGGCLPWRFDKLLVTKDAQLHTINRQEDPAVTTSNAEAALGELVDDCLQDDTACLDRLRKIVEQIGPQPIASTHRFATLDACRPEREPSDIYQIVDPDPARDYEVRDLLACLIDRDSFDQYKADYGQSVVCGTARIGGMPIGIVANQHHRITTSDGHYHFGGVMYVESAEKAARFVMSCNQDWLPILFLQNVNGFMVGRESERNGIIKAGAKLVNAVSNSRVPKITLIVGGSYGAGNYAMCGKAYDPRFIFAWPNASCAVMGGEQATSTLLEIKVKSLQRQGKQIDEQQLAELREKVISDYQHQTDIRYSAAKGWIDGIIDPGQTRQVLTLAFEMATRHVPEVPFHVGVFQV